MAPGPSRKPATLCCRWHTTETLPGDLQDGRRGRPYAGGVEQVTPIEDSRGVDVGQIRRQLAMTVPERVHSMVEAANTMLEIQRHARGSLRRER